MAQFERITHSKNLRFKLISMMYLIFFVLAVMQIPTSWLVVTQPIHTYLNKAKGNVEEPTLSKINIAIIQISNEFKNQLGLNQANSKKQELKAYVATDNFFIKQGNGKLLFQELLKLKKWAYQFPPTNATKKLFDKLFMYDLRIGLQEGNEDLWVKNKFKHVPTELALSLVEELRIRTLLLSQKGRMPEDAKSEPALSLMTKYSSMRVGDSATLTIKGDILDQITVSRDQGNSEDFVRLENGLIFTPKYAGTYLIDVKGKRKSETMEINVQPAGFPKRQSMPLRICYKGVNYTQTLNFKEPGMVVKANADPNAKVNTEQGILSFSPNREGWCAIEIKSSNGSAMFYDSVFVKPLPDPKVLVQGLPSNSIGRLRLRQLKELSLIAKHPSFEEEGVFEILSFNVKKIGSENTVNPITGSHIIVNEKEIETINYILVYDLVIRIGKETKKLDQTLVIQIN
jgi:hypothetical protein